MRWRRHRPLGPTIALALAFGLPWLGCTETTGPDEPFSLEFEALPFPSIVSGDTLRDIEGNVVPLRAVAYNLRRNPIENAEVSFIVVDTSGSVTLDPSTGYLVATGTGRGTVRVVASIGGLQSAPLTLEIVAPPTTVTRFGTIDTLRYSFSNPALNTSPPLEVRVTGDSASAPIPFYVVRFRLATVADTIVARIVDDATRRSPRDPSGVTYLDTTEASGTRAGVAGRRIRLTPGASLAAVDSIVVLAEVLRRGVHISGSPVRLVLPVKARTTAAP